MIETQTLTETVTKNVVTAIVCDRCKKRIDSDDVMQFQEVQQFRFMGGYGSKFGDGNRFACDLCDECCVKMFSPFMRQIVDDVFPDASEPA